MFFKKFLTALSLCVVFGFAGVFEEKINAGNGSSCMRGSDGGGPKVSETRLCCKFVSSQTCKRGDECPYEHSDDGVSICEHGFGGCGWAHSGRFHDPEAPKFKPILCCQRLKGGCSPDCHLSHDYDDGETPCHLGYECEDDDHRMRAGDWSYNVKGYFGDRWDRDRFGFGDGEERPWLCCDFVTKGVCVNLETCPYRHNYDYPGDTPCSNGEKCTNPDHAARYIKGGAICCYHLRGLQGIWRGGCNKTAKNCRYGHPASHNGKTPCSNSVGGRTCWTHKGGHAAATSARTAPQPSSESLVAAPSTATATPTPHTTERPPLAVREVAPLPSLPKPIVYWPLNVSGFQPITIFVPTQKNQIFSHGFPNNGGLMVYCMLLSSKEHAAWGIQQLQRYAQNVDQMQFACEKTILFTVTQPPQGMWLLEVLRANRQKTYCYVPIPKEQAIVYKADLGNGESVYYVLGSFSDVAARQIRAQHSDVQGFHNATVRTVLMPDGRRVCFLATPEIDQK